VPALPAAARRLAGAAGAGIHGRSAQSNFTFPLDNGKIIATLVRFHPKHLETFEPSVCNILAVFFPKSNVERIAQPSDAFTAYWFEPFWWFLFHSRPSLTSLHPFPTQLLADDPSARVEPLKEEPAAPFATEARLFAENRLLHRDVGVRIELRTVASS
jgi:hypothetical protein